MGVTLGQRFVVRLLFVGNRKTTEDDLSGKEIHEKVTGWRKESPELSESQDLCSPMGNMAPNYAPGQGQ